MRKYSSIKELWDRCIFCPICQDKNRTVSVSVQPQEVITLLNYQLAGDIIYLFCIATIKSKQYRVDFAINMLDNSLQTKVEEMEPNSPAVSKSSRPYFSCFFRGVCPKCHCAISFTGDMELNFSGKKISTIEMERETIILEGKPTNYHLHIDYANDSMAISPCLNGKDHSPDLRKQFRTSVIDLDFSNPEKAIKRINTILTFG